MNFFNGFLGSSITFASNSCCNQAIALIEVFEFVIWACI